MEDYLIWTVVFILFIFIIMLTFYTHYVRRERIEMRKEAVVGDMKYSARTADYPSWLICNGRSLNRAEYKELFDVIGTSYGSVSATTFNLPDFRGRVMGGIGQGTSLTNRPIGTSVGEERHLMTVSELVTHTHDGTTNAFGNHSHTGTTETAGEHTHTHNAPGGQGNGGLALADGSNTVTDADDSQGELNVWTTPLRLELNNNGSHTHTFTSAIDGEHTHTFTSNTTGNSSPFNVMQPTLFAGHVFIYYGCVHDI